MAFISITRLRLRSFWNLPRFFRHAVPSKIQAQKAPGNLGVDTLSDANQTFWTKTLWEDEASMRAYMLSGAHQKAMKAFQQIVCEGATTHVEGNALPSWQEAYGMLLKAPRFQKVKYPSADHTARKIPPPRA
jgi:heme-degrading monooxygenase HmoA